MHANPSFKKLVSGALIGGWLLLGVSTAAAHCDGLDGPVVLSAQKALESGDVNRVLIWVPAADEAEIKQAFTLTQSVRTLSADAQKLADTWFLETLVRVHRAGEGFAYTGLKPAGRDIGPAIPAADRAVESGALDEVLKLLPPAGHEAVQAHFADVMAKRDFPTADVEAGRQWVAAYVKFVHLVEAQYTNTGHAHGGCEKHGAARP